MVSHVWCPTSHLLATKSHNCTLILHLQWCNCRSVSSSLKAPKAIVYILPIVVYRKLSSSQPLADPLVIVCHYYHLSSSSLFTCCCCCHVPWVSVVVIVIPSLLIWYHHRSSSIATYLLDCGNEAQPKTSQPSYVPVPLHKPTGLYLISGTAQPSL